MLLVPSSRTLNLLRHLRAATLPLLAGLAGASPGFQGAIRPLSGEGADDLTARGVAFVEIVPERTAVFVHQAVRVVVRMGVTQEQHGKLLQLFQQELDVPVQLDAPWIDGLADVLLAQRPMGVEPAGQRASLALHDRIASAGMGTLAEDGRAWRLLELEGTYVPLRSGVVALPAPVLRFAHATAFEDDLLRGRVARDRREAFVRGEPVTLVVRVLPEEGRPVDFSGAVGRFSVRAQTPPGTPLPGAPIELELHVHGEGYLGAFQPPRLQDPDFRQLGVATRGARTFVYSLAAREGRPTRLPSIPFTYFDPGDPPGYRSLRTAPIDLAVPEAAAAADAAPPPLPPGRSWQPLGSAGLAAGGLAAVLVATGLLRRRARAARRLGGLQAAAERFRARVEGAGEPSEGFLAALAEQLGWAPAAVVSPELALRLAGKGLDPDLAARTQRVVDQWMAARFGGAAPPDAAQVRTLAEELGRALAALDG